MSETGDTSQLEDLEPLPAPGAGAPAAMPVALTGGMPAPAYNPAADREYYRFLFAGVVMLLGCLMPFGPAMAFVGYKTARGALTLLIAVGIVWSAWASIHHRRMIKGLLRWVTLALLPLVLGVVDLLLAFRDGGAVAAWVRAAGPEHSIGSWDELFGQLGNVLAPGDQVGEFIRHFGSGRLVVFAGALLAEAFMVLAIFGGARKLQEQKAERRAAASARRKY